MIISLELVLHFSILVPLLASLLIVVARKNSNYREAMSIASALLLIYLVVNLYTAVSAAQPVSAIWWELMPGLNISFSIEPLGVLFALIASFLWLVTVIYAIGYMRSHQEQNQTRFYCCFAVAISAVMGIAFSANLFTLFIFYEVLTLSTYPLVTHSGTEEAKKSGRIYLGILLGTSILFLLPAVAGTWVVTNSLDFTTGGIFSQDVDKTVAGILLLLFVLGVGKAAVMPFHRWLTAAMVAPTPVSALLHAVAVVKAGVFTLLKICLFIFGLDLLPKLFATQFLLYLVGSGVLLASIVAMRQDNLKLRLAYSTISQLGYVTVGALLASSSGVIGSTFHIAAHAFGKITLFFCAGAILVSLHKSKISEMRGIGRLMPVTMLAFFIASLSIIGVPPAGGTWSKWFLLMGGLEAGQYILMTILMISSLLNIAYLMPIPICAFFPNVAFKSRQGHIVNGGTSGRLFESLSDLKEAPWPSLLAIIVTSSACIVLFFYPQPLFQLAKLILTFGLPS